MARFKRLGATAAAILGSIILANPASAQDKPAETDRLQIKPILEARLRYEAVDQGPLNADAVTFRLRAGAEANLGQFSLLAEGEGAFAPIDHYNAFPFAIDDSQRRTKYAVVSDPENL